MKEPAKKDVKPLGITPIGTIRSPFRQLTNMPIQPRGAREVEGEVIVEDRYSAGLKDLAEFSHIYLLYYFHQAARTELLVVPFLDTQRHGVFSTRSPLRPSHLGLSVVELLEVRGNRLRVRGLDVLDGTPLIDIKPYLPPFDCHPEATSGWMRSSREEIAQKRSDDRYL
jgi:tRNA-Thr(GGU) m(6)t(6)A37 methyltransferase TsaA